MRLRTIELNITLHKSQYNYRIEQEEQERAARPHYTKVNTIIGTIIFSRTRNPDSSSDTSNRIKISFKTLNILVYYTNISIKIEFKIFDVLVYYFQVY